MFNSLSEIYFVFIDLCEVFHGIISLLMTGPSGNLFAP